MKVSDASESQSNRRVTKKVGVIYSALGRYMGDGETFCYCSLFNLAGLCEIIERLNTGREETRVKYGGLDQTKMI